MQSAPGVTYYVCVTRLVVVDDGEHSLLDHSPLGVKEEGEGCLGQSEVQDSRGWDLES